MHSAQERLAALAARFTKLLREVYPIQAPTVHASPDRWGLSARSLLYQLNDREAEAYIYARYNGETVKIEVKARYNWITPDQAEELATHLLRAARLMRITQ